MGSNWNEPNGYDASSTVKSFSLIVKEISDMALVERQRRSECAVALVRVDELWWLSCNPADVSKLNQSANSVLNS